eukprot:gb/GFBE01027974.1/.p1 GENE.gb/GFBE01027974.1/~~gb/GFBE01027974.1/.p1  ORF type:complete len:191 (+),score=49.12 gb/GFBE01027974.1/:1-573(+)
MQGQQRYTGTLKFYNSRQGNGVIVVDPGFEPVEGIPVPAELHCGSADIDAGGGQAPRMENVAVEFGICKIAPTVEALKACKVTLPGGLPMTLEALENRQVVNGHTYFGEVARWNDLQGWGFIKADPAVPLPPFVQAKLAQQAQASSQGEELIYLRKSDLMEGVKIDKGSQVMFRAYVDDKGVGACRIQAV